MDMSQYKALFLSESREYLRSIAEQVVALEQSPAERSAVDALFRGAHSLKGMAASMEYGDVVVVAHGMEDLMARVRDGALPFDAGVADLLLEGVDLIDALLDDVEQERPSTLPTGDYAQRLAIYTPARPKASREVQAEPEPTHPDAAAPPAAEAEKAKESAGEAGGTVRVKTELLDHLINLTGELVTNKQRLLNIGRELASPALDDAVSETAKLLRALHDEVMKVRLMPFEAISDRFQRSVRSVAKKSGKEIHFELTGREIGLDRGMLEQLVDPLNHILRNAVDHGIEESGERERAGKPARGTVWLAVTRDRDRIQITVRDDGRGMEPKAMIEAAIAKGVLSPEEGELLSPDQALMLSCIPGFSTAKEVTDISGRGVGMDAVNAAIQKLGGTLGIDSEPGRGTTITLRLPLTIAIIHALVVQIGQVKAAIPVNAVQRTVELSRGQIETMGKRQMFQLDGEPIPLLSLNRVLGLPLGRFPDGILPLFVTQAKGRRVGIVVDRLLGQHELFVKQLGRPLSKMAGVAGGATLGDGEIVAILDLAGLL
ncbi:chemotaxis protein CheA [Geomonas sp. Red69]|uniref:chemotaxis protein CheA n=1 Tax=Geomonas diazotrophica TaxID=2843197 RepID=UPI001C0F8F2A|nr:MULTISPECIES: chemotaxis protein CheA [Geomonas]MBU5635685.1 chemotaxis protein CheA [Geomonas diazotrophica]QXE87207.1 chemotaxis protein CheA [Geomonas nitrogeniifigens]